MSDVTSAARDLALEGRYTAEPADPSVNEEEVTWVSVCMCVCVRERGVTILKGYRSSRHYDSFMCYLEVRYGEVCDHKPDSVPHHHHGEVSSAREVGGERPVPPDV